MLNKIALINKPQYNNKITLFFEIFVYNVIIPLVIIILLSNCPVAKLM